MVQSKLTGLAAAVFVLTLAGLSSVLGDTLPRAAQNQAMEAAAEQAAHQALNVSPAVSADIAALVELTRSAAFQAEQEHRKSQLRELLGLADPAPGDTDRALSTANPHRAVLFISSSVPVATLRNYAADLEKIDGVLVLRGLVQGMKKIGPTVEFIASILRVEPHCQGPKCVMRKTAVIVDPLLFRANGITQVPAFAFQPNMALETYCSRDAGAAVPTSRAVIYGDSALSGLIIEYARLSKDTRVNTFLKELDRG